MRGRFGKQIWVWPVGLWVLCLATHAPGQVSATPVRASEHFSQWQVDLSLRKQNFVVGEPIPYKVTLRALTESARARRGYFSVLSGFFSRVIAEKTGREAKPVIFEDQATELPFGFRAPFLKESGTMTGDMELILGDITNTESTYPRFEVRGGSHLGPRVTQWLMEPDNYRLEVVFAVGVTGAKGVPADDRHGRVWASVPFEVLAPSPRERAALELFAVRPEPPRQVGWKDGKPVLEHSWDAPLEAHRKVVRDFGDTAYAVWSQYYVARIEQARGNHAAAIEAYYATLKLNADFPLKADLLVHEAQCRIALQDRAGATALIEKLEREFPNTATCAMVEFRPGYQKPRTPVETIKAAVTALPETQPAGKPN